MSSNRRVIPITCALHGTRGFSNLVVTKEDGDIVLDPHATGACVLLLNEAEARALHGIIGEMLG